MKWHKKTKLNESLCNEKRAAIFIRLVKAQAQCLNFEIAINTCDTSTRMSMIFIRPNGANIASSVVDECLSLHWYKKMNQVSFLRKALKIHLMCSTRKTSKTKKLMFGSNWTKSNKKPSSFSMKLKNPHVQHRTTSTKIYRDTNQICQCGCIMS